MYAHEINLFDFGTKLVGRLENSLPVLVEFRHLFQQQLDPRLQ